MKKLLVIISLLFDIYVNSQTVTIGNQVWKTQNLNVDKFQNGDYILQAKTAAEWVKADEDAKPAWCYYNNDPSNGEKYGKLYNWYAVNDPRGLAPKGWHVPSDLELEALTNHLGGEKVAGKKLKSKNGWQADGNGTDESGFTGLAGGYRDFDGANINIGIEGYWWSKSQYGNYFAWTRKLSYGNSIFASAFLDFGYGFSIRLVKDDVNRSVLDNLQGKWQDLDDNSSCLLFEKNLKKELYNEKVVGSETFILTDKCPNEESDYGFGSGKDKYISDEFCYYISELNSEYLTLVFMSRGNTLKYKRVK
jgi:uncharacterized protein (TIGR02145 family)